MNTEKSKKELIIPESTRALYDQLHFAPATKVGNTIWVSGQVGVDQDHRPGVGMREQATLAFESLKALLSEAGATLDDVVEINTFHTDLRGEIEAFTQVKDAYFPSRYPCWTAVGVTQLAYPELCIEIRAVAVVGVGSN